MSFGGFGNNTSGSGGFSGFGNNNNNNNNNNPASTGFGASNTNTTSGGSLFGGNTATSGGFGGGFGATNTQQNNPFAPKPAGAFGTTTTTSGGGGGMFGGSTTSTSGGFGGGQPAAFGNTANTSAGGAFGASTGGGLFGQNKPASTGFGASTSGGSLFGGGAGNTAGGFGANTAAPSNPFGANTSSNTNTGFGGSNAGGSTFTGFGASTAATSNNGTATTPFQAIQEKEQSGSGMQSYQSLTFQEPYKNVSFEELRVQDYAQGRRYGGNTNGQPGAFGQSTGFGGFNNNTANTSTSGGMFGNNTATSGNTLGTGFGANANANTSSTFGNNTGGGLFGQNKPATGGMFGNSTTSAAPTSNPFGGTSGSTGGLFGNNNNSATGSFGQGATANTGGGMFGNNNQQPQSSNPFGQSSTTGGGLFGGQQNKPATGGMFGNANPGASTGGGLFGNNNQQQQPAQSNPFGQSSTTGGGLFGNANNQAQSKPGGFSFGPSTNTGNSFGGSTNAGGGLFGNNNQQSNNTGGGLFGNQNKPATGGMFGNSTNTNTSGGLFSNNQQQTQNAGGSLFGASNTGGGMLGSQNKPPTGSLFGNSGSTNTGGAMFGNTQNNQTGNTGGGMFGNMSQSQQNPGASFYNSTNGQQQNQQPNQLHASLTSSPYGNEQLFASLAASSPPVGPLATPLNGAKPAPRKTPSLMASMRMNSPAYTPRGSSIGRTAGYGFSYSTYGTPGSAFSGSLTPGASSLLRPTGSFGSALSSRLNKSISMGNLRGDGTPNEGRSLLRESALSPPGSGRYGGGSIRKLSIDRSLRTDLFEKPKEEEQPSRRVRYDSTADQPREIPEASQQNALVRTESQDTEQEPESPALIRAPPKVTSRQPEMSQVNGANGALSTVPENDVPQRPGSAPATQQKSAPKAPSSGTKDKTPGVYWTEPALYDLKNMSRQQLQKLGKFVVGRNGAGYIEFGACDLSTTNLEDIEDGIVKLTTRSATVYEDNANKPAMGKALNVPATIYLENSWPRSHGGRKAVTSREGREYEKHIARLKRVGGTKFVDYDPETGVWKFTVDHFTTYGLDDDEDDEEFTETEQVDSSGLSEVPATPNGQEEDQTMDSVDTGNGEGEVDDTFEFKLNRRSQISVPGGFEEPSVSYDYDDPSGDEPMDDSQQQVDEHLGSSGGAVQAPSPGAVERYHSSLLEEDEEQTGDVDMTAAEDEDEEPDVMPGSFAPQEPKMLRSILKPSRAMDAFASPEKLATESWEEQLQRTISPKKRDRLALKEMQQSLIKAKGSDDVIESPFKQSLLGKSGMGKSTLGQSTFGQSHLAQKSAKKGKAPVVESLGKSQAFKTSMDIMNSLWADDKTTRKAGNGVEYPYAKRPRLSDTDLDENDAAFHDCRKPSFAADGTLVYAAAGSAPQASGQIFQSKVPIVGEHTDVRFAKFSTPEDLRSATVQTMMVSTTVDSDRRSGMPVATTDRNLLFRDMATSTSAAADQERAIWQLCSVLFDPLEIACADFVNDVPDPEDFVDELRKDAFTALWSRLVSEEVDAGLRQAKPAEEKAVLLLTKNDVLGACEALVSAKDFRLASLVSQLPGSKAMRGVMAKQIEAWKSRRDWSEMSDAVRTLYSILAGVVCTISSQAGAPEDRAAGFSVAERFGLSWKQSLALQVYYGGHFALEDGFQAYEADNKAEKGEDTLVMLCRLFASLPAEGADISVLCEPLAVSGSALNSRIGWQLASILRAKRMTGVSKSPDERSAQLTLAFASELEAAGLVVESAWALLHLENGSERQKAITSLLQRNAGQIAYPSAEPGAGEFERLTIDLKVPRSTVFAAKALYEHARGDSEAQARFLLNGGFINEAHDVLRTTVGPNAVIEMDYDQLATLLSQFPQKKPAGWERGGQVYEAFVHLMRMPLAQKHGQEGVKLVRLVRRGLGGLEEEAKTLEQRVAVSEIKRLVDGVATEQNEREKRAEMGSLGAGKEMLERYRGALGIVV